MVQFSPTDDLKKTEAVIIKHVGAAQGG